MPPIGLRALLTRQESCRDAEGRCARNPIKGMASRVSGETHPLQARDPARQGTLRANNSLTARAVLD